MYCCAERRSLHYFGPDKWESAKPMRCIFCLSSEPATGFTDEHVFPEAVGGTLVVPFVCKACNDRLGHSVDVTVTDHSLVAIKRHALGIPGKSGVIPNPFERAVLTEDPSHKVRLDFTKPSPAAIYTLPFIQRTQSESGKGTLSVRIDATDADRLGTIVNKALARAGAPPVSPEVIEELKTQVVRTEQPSLSIPLSFDLSQFRRGLMKIVYELTCLWLGEIYVEDAMATLLRQFIFDDQLPFGPSSRYPIRGTMRMAPKEPLLPFWPKERDHLMACLINNGSLSVIVSILGVLDACVAITDSPQRYPQCQQRFVSINSQTGEMRESTFEEEVVRICNEASCDEVEGG
jgi:hypothetical protein